MSNGNAADGLHHRLVEDRSGLLRAPAAVTEKQRCERQSAFGSGVDEEGLSAQRAERVLLSQSNVVPNTRAIKTDRR
jgi:hypothetical protein